MIIFLVATAFPCCVVALRSRDASGRNSGDRGFVFGDIVRVHSLNKEKASVGSITSVDPLLVMLSDDVTVNASSKDLELVPVQCVCSSPVATRHKTTECMGHCSIEACHMNLGRFHDWSFAHGDCCDATSTHSQDGCQSDVPPISNDTAKAAVLESLTVAIELDNQLRNGTNISEEVLKSSFFAMSLQDHMTLHFENLSQSFDNVRDQNMSASRSHAQFFSTDDKRYILKSIDPYEYDTLFKLSQSAFAPLPLHLSTEPSMINHIIIGFKYQATCWLVIRNSITEIRSRLEDQGFRRFYKPPEVFDVKPLPIYSEQRPLFLEKHALKRGLRAWHNFDNMYANFQKDAHFLATVLSNPLVDWSLLVSIFYIDANKTVLPNPSFPNCIERTFAELGYGDQVSGSMLMCFSIIDLLLEFTNYKSFENALLWWKWSDWEGKALNLVRCLGNTRPANCSGYNYYHSAYKGLDVDIVNASLRDMTAEFSPDDGFVSTGSKIRYKCCCSADTGYCTLVKHDDFRKCGDYFLKGYHSFQWYARRCWLSSTQAASLSV